MRYIFRILLFICAFGTLGGSIWALGVGNKISALYCLMFCVISSLILIALGISDNSNEIEYLKNEIKYLRGRQ